MKRYVSVHSSLRDACRAGGRVKVYEVDARGRIRRQVACTRRLATLDDGPRHAGPEPRVEIVEQPGPPPLDGLRPRRWRR